MSNWNLSAIEAQILARKFGIELKTKVNEVFRAVDNTWKYVVPIMDKTEIYQYHNPRYINLVGPAFKTVEIPMSLYRDEEGNTILMGYNEEYSLLVWSNHNPPRSLSHPPQPPA